MEFDHWLQKEYLPPGFILTDEDDPLKTLIEKPWYRRLRFDLKEVYRCISLTIIFNWCLSLVCFVIVIKCDYTPDSVTNSKHDGRSLLFDSLNNASTSNTISNMTTSVDPIFSFDFYRLGSMINPDPTNQHPKSRNTEKAFAIFDFSILSVFMLYLGLYITHLIEGFPQFNWYLIEIILMGFYSLVMMALVIALCVVSKLISLIIIGIVQTILATLFVIRRYNLWKSGNIPQDDNDDVDNDSVRNLKLYFAKADLKHQGSKKKFSLAEMENHVDMFNKMVPIEMVNPLEKSILKIKNSRKGSMSKSKESSDYKTI